MDKKFCNDYCRNTHNNRLNSDGNNFVRNVNHCLRKNRRILESLLPSTQLMGKVSKQTLYSKGFMFSYYTQTHTNKKGNTYHFCYEFGYQLLAGEKILILRRKGKEG